MANQIRLTPDDMRARANEYREQGQVVGEVISKMDHLLAALREEWEGDASRAYEDKYLSLKPGFEEAQDLIEQIAKALDSTANTVESTDSAIASQFRQ